MNRFKHKISEHIQSNWWIYLLITVCFLTGLIFGAIGARSLNTAQNTALSEFVNTGLASFDNDFDFSATTRQALSKNLYNLVKMFVLGLTVIGLPLILAIVFTRGFVLGFTAMFLIQQRSWQGGLIALLAVLPPNFLSLPVYFLASVMAINFSLFLIRGNNQRGTSLAQYFLGYLGYFLLMAIIMLAAALIEGYFSPFLIRLLQ